MLWKVRTTLEDRPGALARLAQSCGDHGANILALQIFPDLDGVTDELVVSTPPGWAPGYLAGLVTRAGGRDVRVRPVPERALVDEPTRYLQAARQLQEGRVPVAEVLAHLLEATPCAAGACPAGTADDDGHTLTVEVAGTTVRLHRAEEFTATEHARAAALAAVADAADGVRTPAPVSGDDAGVVLRAAKTGDHQGLQRMHARCSSRTILHRYGVPLLRLTDRLARHLTGPDAVVAVVSHDGVEELVGIAQVVRRGGGTAPELTVLVEDDWQRRGIGARLVRAALGLLATEGYREVVLRGQVDNPGLVPLVARLGTRVRVRVVGDMVTVVVGVPAAGPGRPGEHADALPVERVTERAGECGTAPGAVGVRG